MASFGYVAALKEALDGQRVVVTGGCGFLGQHVCRILLESGCRVTAMDIRETSFMNHRQLTLVRGDLLKPAELQQHFSGADAVVHVASMVPGPDPSLAGLVRRVNVDGTQNVVDACRQCRVRRLVYTSSASVAFDGSSTRNFHEESKIRGNMDEYSKTKSDAEKIILAAGGGDSKEADSLLTCSIRPHGIFGPGDPHMLPAVAKAGREGKSQYMIGDGTNVVDFTYVKNVAYAHVLAVAKLNESISGKAYFITNNDPVLFWDFMSDLQRGMGFALPRIAMPFSLMYGLGAVAEALGSFGLPAPTFTRQRVSYAGKDHFFSSARARRELGYIPPYTLENARQETLEEFRKKHPELVPHGDQETCEAVDVGVMLSMALVTLAVVMYTLVWRQGLSSSAVAVMDALLVGAALAGVRRYMRGPSCVFRPDDCYDAEIKKRTVVVTGGNRGIGFGIAKRFCELGANVVLACRNARTAADAVVKLKELTGNQRVTFRQLDLSSFASVKAFVAQLAKAGFRVDYLINNAGLMCGKSTTGDGHDMQMQVNHLSHALLTLLLLEKRMLSEEARLVHVSSWMHMYGRVPFDDFNFDRPGAYANFKVYTATKLCQVMFSNELHRRLRGGAFAGEATDACTPHVTSVAVHPGNGETDFITHFIPGWFKSLATPLFRIFLSSPQECADSVMYAALHKDVQGTGGHYFDGGRFVRASAAARDRTLMLRLWNKTLAAFRQHLDSAAGDV